MALPQGCAPEKICANQGGVRVIEATDAQYLYIITFAQNVIICIGCVTGACDGGRVSPQDPRLPTGPYSALYGARGAVRENAWLRAVAQSRRCAAQQLSEVLSKVSSLSQTGLPVA